MSKKTGITLNNEVEKFNKPNIGKHSTVMTSGNFVSPMKLPLSSIAPSIFTDEAGDIRLIIGGTGGIKIITSVAYVSTNMFPQSISSGITQYYHISNVVTFVSSCGDFIHSYQITL
jgi:gamma-glutamyltranspeptidase/glutathione hydrolase/leukotriene-C4 hydrolase